MAQLPKKQYGLIIKKNEPNLLAVKSAAAVAFANSDEDDDNTIDTNIMKSKSESASIMRVRMQAKREHERALAQDPSIFDYDAVYEDLQASKNQKLLEQKTADRERKSKYAEQILKAHKRRLLEQQGREERKQLKEREAENGEFEDKEVFVTGAYRKQMEEMQKFREQEAVENRLDELTAVEKQKEGMWQGGFYRSLLNDLSRKDDQTSSSDRNSQNQFKEEVTDENDVEMNEAKDELEKACSSKCASLQSKQQKVKFSEKVKSLRRRESSSSGDGDDSSLKTPKDRSSDSEQRRKMIESAKKLKKKSIYSSDDESESDSNAPLSPLTNEGPILKPGLNILPKATKKPTKAQQLQRRFTPSPTGSGNNDSSGDERDITDSRERRRTRAVEQDRGTRNGRSRKYRRERSKSSSVSPSGKRHKKRDGHRNHDRRERRHRSDRPEHGEEWAPRDKRSRKRPGDDEKKKIGKDEVEVKGGKAKNERAEKDTKKPITKQERLQRLKEVLKQRNSDKEIAEFRQRYLERKQNVVVTIPV
ncbi:unnamed protein product [Anisakis simplex]|uniref:DUF2040 domain-containing protein n=1 Tax=Anisakis simplex TaxID=6269 RepID=A0A0M3K0Z4_ANISI|nr:unnamed protein product [Anisakis simplex]